MEKVAVVIGSSRGIGRKIIEELVKNNYSVVITYKDHLEEALKVRKSEKSLITKCDVTKEDDIIGLVHDVIDLFGHIDVLVNNVGIAIDNLVEDKTKDEFMKVLDTNLVGPFLVIKHFLKYLDGKTVINISSTDGIDTYNEYNIDYSVSKAGLIHLTKAMALAYTYKNIKFYSIAPNFVKTDPVLEMNPDYLKEELKRVGQNKLIEPEEVAKKVIEVVNSDLKSGSIIEIRGDK